MQIKTLTARAVRVLIYTKLTKSLLLFLLVSIKICHRVYIISLTPKFPVAVCKFHISPFLIYHQTTLPFQIPHESRNAHFERDTYQHMDMIRAYLSLDHLHSFPLAQLSQYLSYFHSPFFIKYFPPVFWREHDMILAIPFCMC